MLGEMTENVGFTKIQVGLGTINATVGLIRF